jgi:hypothetical protein
MSDGANQPTIAIFTKLPPIEEVRARLCQSKREVALLKQLLRLSEKAAYATVSQEREAVNA